MLPFPHCLILDGDQGTHAEFTLFDFETIVLTFGILTHCPA